MWNHVRFISFITLLTNVAYFSLKRLFYLKGHERILEYCVFYDYFYNLTFFNGLPTEDGFLQASTFLPVNLILQLRKCSKAKVFNSLRKSMLDGLRDELPNHLQGWLHYRICELVQTLLWLLWRSRLPTSAQAELQKGSPHFTLITNLPFYLMPQSLHDLHASDQNYACASFYFNKLVD